MLFERTDRGTRIARNLGQLQPVTLSHGRHGIELRCEGVDGRGESCLRIIPLNRLKAEARAALVELVKHRDAGTQTPAAASWDAYQSSKDARFNRPMAVAGLTSYRYKSAYSGYIMIGAKDDADALREARRTRSDAVAAGVEVWNGSAYVAAAGLELAA